MSQRFCRGTLYIEYERDWSVGLSAMLSDGQKIKTLFLVSGIFLGKADSVILLGIKCTINAQNINKIVGDIFEKIEILNLFLMWTTLNFGVNSKTERTGRRYLQGDSWYRIWTSLVVGLGAILADGQKIKNYLFSFGDFFGKSR